MANKKSTSFRLSSEATEALTTMAEMEKRSLTNMLEVLIAEAKKDLEARGKWPVKG